MACARLNSGDPQQILPSPYIPLQDKVGSIGQEPYEAYAFRLIILSPLSEGENLNCRLLSSTLGRERGKYEALSYQWGSKDANKPIFLNEQQHQVSLNLHEALCDLRHPHECSKIWVDALCINQADVQEKSIQVARMAYIYSSAARTIAYLGQASEATAIAVDFIQRLTLLEKDSQQLHNALHHKNCRQQWAALGEILNNTYWTRIWIVQEIAVSSRVVLRIGGHLIELDLLENAVLKLVNSFINNIHMDIHIVLPQLQLNAVWAVLEARRRYQSRSKPKLDELLVLFLSSHATKPMDKVYGVYSMCAEA